MSSLENEVEKLMEFVSFVKEKNTKLEAENERLNEYIKYIEEDSRKEKKSLKEIRNNLQLLKVTREKLSGLLEKWNSVGGWSQ